MTRRPAVVVFDVNETLSDMSPLADRFQEVGAAARDAELWFATVLRDGFALTAAGASQPFSVVAEDVLRRALRRRALNRSEQEAVDHILAGMRSLTVHTDVVAGVRRIRELGIRLVTLSNGAASVAARLLTQAGVRDAFEALLSVDDAGAWKPAPSSYRYAAQVCGVPIADLLLVAVHPWDTDGARRAGAAAAWINRDGAQMPDYVLPPTLTATSLDDLASELEAIHG